MKKLIATVISILISTAVCYADRLSYTDELVDAAGIIAFWSDDELRKIGDSIKLGRSSTVFMAKDKYLHVSKDRLSGKTIFSLNSEALQMLEQYQYSERLNRVLREIVDHKWYILFLGINDGRVDIIGDRGYIECNGITEKVIDDIVRQKAYQAKWDELSVKEQIARSDFIIKGTIRKGMIYPVSYYLKTDKVYRGELSDAEIGVLPTSDDNIGNTSLFFLTKNFGSGPDYRVMKAVPLEKADEYLNILPK